MKKLGRYSACPVCLKPHPEGSSINKVYCSKTCTSKARRQRAAAARRADLVNALDTNGIKMLLQLQELAPQAARSAEKLVTAHGADCAEAAVKLALTAYFEAKNHARLEAGASDG